MHMKHSIDDKAFEQLLNEVTHYIDAVYVEDEITASFTPIVSEECICAPQLAPCGYGALPTEQDEDNTEWDNGDVAYCPDLSRREAQRDNKLRPQCPTRGIADRTNTDLASRLEQLDESFARTVMRLIDERGMRDADVYKRANMSRQLFAKIRKDNDYRPTKRTACALAFALGLNHNDALALLSRAGFTLSHSSKFDVIIEYFLMNHIHDIQQINMTLYSFDQQILG